jgi:hypothetical protein
MPRAYRQPRLALGDQVRLEAAGTVAWLRNLDLAIFSLDRLRICAVAAVAAAAASRIALLVPQVFGQFGSERAFDQLRLQLLEKARTLPSGPPASHN